MLKINEIFKSIQGESSYAGLPCAFVRLTGCDLRCHYCDTQYAFYEGKDMSVDQVIAEVDNYGLRLVEITGGEPLLQGSVYPLMAGFLRKGYQVLLETSGSMPIKDVPEEVVKIMDLKCPASGEESQNEFDNINHLSQNDEVKFVLLDRKDYEWSRDILRKYSLDKKCQVLFSPVYDKLNIRDLALWILDDRLPVRLQTQLHKIIWGKDAIGV
jgi:7-carboxy-7-deazaguanine synthase